MTKHVKNAVEFKSKLEYREPATGSFYCILWYKKCNTLDNVLHFLFYTIYIVLSEKSLTPKYIFF